MCGIAGIVSFDGLADDAPALAVAMRDVLVHRGPDEAGLHCDRFAALAHRRLSIVDLGNGQQPMCNEDGSIWIVFNGEIYNHAEIRARLESAGHRYRTQSDTETIIHAYEQWGDDCVRDMRGMFAFAIWDAPKRRLLLVRDRLGVKPLYYHVHDNTVTFGSELKALLQHPDVRRDWDPAALDAFLAFQYIPAPGSIYRHISKLPAAHLLVFENGRASMRRYWTLPFTGEETRATEPELLDQLDELVTESVRLRLLSDVPLGAFLSGGIDSSVVVAAMAKLSPGRVVTTSVGFAEHAFNELEYARTVATHLGTERHEQIVTPDIVDLLPRLAWHFDEPFADSSMVPTYYVSAAARQHVTVALSGDGGDELWAGYARHRVERWEGRMRRWLGGTGSALAGQIGARLPLSVKGARALRHLGLSPAEACADKHAYSFFEGGERASLYASDFASAVDGADPFSGFRQAYADCASPDALDRALYVDANTYLIDDIMTKVDRASMAVSLEAREPLLDHKLLEFAARVPARFKIRGGQGKYLLRRLLERSVPKSIVDRPKHGFEAPIGEWLRKPLAPMAADLFFDGRMHTRGVFDVKTVERLWSEHQSGARDHRHRLWSLLMLELWFREFADAPVSRRSAPEVAA
ncbi:MAG TPA: asparagine synthase (glutamine-hydrolyzing) [Vicinamibacterales bacterium]|nr:asparagine synthase (glutamine-hydrolyzing) [Vicinamibacterales bacterium]